MNFVSTQFFVFLAVLFLLYYTIPRRHQWKLLLVGSLFFYFFAGWYCLIYIGVTTLTTYFAAKKVTDLAQEQDAYMKEHKADLSREERKAYKAAGKALRWRWTLGCLLLNFGILGVVKYTGFVAGNLNSLLSLTGSQFRLTFSAIALPMGISFYTFQSLGYLIDVYWGKYPAEKSLGKFALFVTFFPQLIQGPISRFSDLSQSLYAEHPFDSRQFGMGAQRVLWGLAKKLIVADRLAIPLITLVGDPETYNGVYVLAVMGYGGMSASIIGEMIFTTAYMSLALAVFNLLPISPLDGSKVLFSFLKPHQYYKLMRYERYGMIVLIVLMLTDILGNPLSAVTGWVYDRLFFLAEWGGELFMKIF